MPVSYFVAADIPLNPVLVGSNPTLVSGLTKCLNLELILTRTFKSMFYFSLHIDVQ